MSSKTAGKRKRQERRQQEMSLGERARAGLGSYFTLGRLALIGVAAAAIVGAVFLVSTLGGGAESGRIIDNIANERTSGLGVSASVGSRAPNFEAQDLLTGRSITDNVGATCVSGKIATNLATAFRREA